MSSAQATLNQVLFDGAPTTDFRNRLELGRRLFDIAPAETHTVTHIYEVPEVLTSDGYRLLIQNQATPWPDEFSVDVSGPGICGDWAPRGVRAGGIARLVGAAYLGEGAAGRGGGAVVTRGFWPRILSLLRRPAVTHDS